MNKKAYFKLMGLDKVAQITQDRMRNALQNGPQGFRQNMQYLRSKIPLQFNTMKKRIAANWNKDRIPVAPTLQDQQKLFSDFNVTNGALNASPVPRGATKKDLLDMAIQNKYFILPEQKEFFGNTQIQPQTMKEWKTQVKDLYNPYIQAGKNWIKNKYNQIRQKF